MPFAPPYRTTAARCKSAKGGLPAVRNVSSRHFHLKYTAVRPYICVMADQLHQDAETKRGTDWLASAGLRPTRQRVLLARLLIGDGNNRHVTAESLHLASQSTAETVSLATVYNTLRAFCDAGLMREITVDGSKSYFDTRIDDHPHFFWEGDGKLTDAPAADLEIARLPDAPEGAEIAKVDVVIRLRKT